MPESLIKDLGPCNVSFNDVDLGKTMGGVIFRDATEERPIMEDQAGTTPVDALITGRTVTVDCPLTRASLAQLVAVIPGASSFGSYIIVNNQAGITKLQNAQKLELIPLVDGAESSDRLTIFLASPRTDIEIVFDNDNQRVYKVVFSAFPDSANNNRMYQIGNTVA